MNQKPIQSEFERNAELGVTAYNLARSPGETRSAREIFDELSADTPALAGRPTVFVVGRGVGRAAVDVARVAGCVIVIEKGGPEDWEATVKALAFTPTARLAPREAHVDSFNVQSCDYIFFVHLTDEELKVERDRAVDTIQKHQPYVEVYR